MDYAGLLKAKPHLLAGYAISAFLVFVLSCILITKKLNLVQSHAFYSGLKFGLIKKEFLMALPFGLIVGTEVLYDSFSVFLVEHHCVESDLGLFTGVKKIVTGLSIFSIVATSALMPAISRMTATLNKKKIFIILLLHIIISVLGLLFFGIYFLFNQEFVELILGGNFLKVLDWDMHIAKLILGRYLIVVPAIYLITSGRHFYRLTLVTLMVLIGVYALHSNLNPLGVKYAVQVIADISLWLGLFLYCGFASKSLC